MSIPAENAEYDAVEIRNVEDILDCTTDTTEPLLLTQAAVDGGDDVLLAVNRDVVSHVLDAVDSLDAVSQDALRSYSLDFYAHAIEEVGFSGYRARADRQVDAYVMQALKLAGAQRHLDLFVTAAVDPEAVDDAAFDAGFTDVEADEPLVASNAAYLRDLDGIQILSDGNLDVALDIVLAPRGAGVEALRWNGVVADVPVNA